MIKELEFLKPHKCPFKLIRIGGKKDGGYLIPNDLIGVEACFSPGVSNFKNFEDHLAIQYQIKSHMCDFSSDVHKFNTKIIEGLQTFEKKWLDIEENENNISLNNWVNKYSYKSKRDLILQMDIEGAEYRNLLDSDTKLLARFRIIVLELHNVQDIFDKKQCKDVKSLLKKLNKTHICVHAHPNNCEELEILSREGMNIPNVLEVSFLRKDRFKNKTKFYQVELPNYLDIDPNVVSKKPLHLNLQWTNSKRRSIRSKIKILSDYYVYYLHHFKKVISNLILN